MQVYDLANFGLRGAAWSLIAVSGLLIALSVYTLRTPTFEASSDGLRIRGSLFGRMIPAAALRLEGARIIDLHASPDMALKWRTFGVGLPGYQAGWFSLNDGEKALVFLAGGNHALYIPTTEGYALLIAPNDPQGCLRSLTGAGP
ncbi:MAG: PH domain-containing protein [Rhodospirillaceae bacterium]